MFVEDAFLCIKSRSEKLFIQITDSNQVDAFYESGNRYYANGLLRNKDWNNIPDLNKINANKLKLKFVSEQGTLLDSTSMKGIKN